MRLMLVKGSAQDAQRHSTWAMWVTGLLVGVTIIVFAGFSIGRYDRYNATGWDLGIFTQLTWNASRGHFLQNTLAEVDNMLGVHAPYITIVLAPLFWLWADPRTLLIAQAVILCVGAVPIARLARRHVGHPWSAPAFAALWLLYPALGWLNRWDFHEIAPAATLLAFAFEAADRRAWLQTNIWLLLALLCKEEMGLNVAFFGIYIYMLRRDRRSRWICLAMFVLGCGWFLVHAFVIFPAVRQATNALPIHAARYNWLLSGDPATMLRFIAGPEGHLADRFAYLIKLFAPTAFVAFFAPAPLIVALPTLALSLLSSYSQQYDIFLHYTAPVIPAILTATVYGAARVHKWLAARTLRGWRFLVGPMFGATILMWLIYNPFVYFPKGTGIYGWEPGAHLAALYEVERLIPPDACVVASNNIEPHYSTRPETYVLGARPGDSDGCRFLIVDMDDPRHHDYTNDVEVACFQFWSRKRTPIYFRDSVVVLEAAPAREQPEPTRQMQAYCDSYAKSSTP